MRRSSWIAVMVALASIPAAGAAPSTRILLARGEVLQLAAEGGRAALVVAGRPSACASVQVWTPAERRTAMLQSARSCERGNQSPREATTEVALAGTRAAWVRTAGGNTLETIVLTATLRKPRPVMIGFAIAEDERHGAFLHALHGDGNLIAFTADRRCRTAQPEQPSSFPCGAGVADGRIDRATVWRFPVQGAVACPEPTRRLRICSPVVGVDDELTVVAVDSGRIALRRASGAIELIGPTGLLIRRFPPAPPGASVALQGTQLAVQRGTTLTVYATRSGAATVEEELQGSAPRLQDLDRGIAVYVSNGRVRALRLSDGRDTVIVRGRLAQIEAPGLFAALTRQVTFIPRAVILRKLATAG